MFLLGAGVSMLTVAFQFMQQDGQIFMSYRQWWVKKVLKSHEGRTGFIWNGCEKISYDKDAIWYIKFLAYIAKPMSICPYCNGTWLAIITFIYLYGFNYAIFIFIGIVFFFTRLIMSFGFDKYNH